MILYEPTGPGKIMKAIEYTESGTYYYEAAEEEFRHFPDRPLHSHGFYELTIVLSGSVSSDRKNTALYRAGDCCLCNRNIHHKEYFDTDFEIILFMFQEEYIRDLLSANVLYDSLGNPYPYSSMFHHLFVLNDNNPFYSAKQYIDFRQKKPSRSDVFPSIIHEMIREITENKSGKSYMMRGYFCRWIEYMEDSENFDISIHHAKLSTEEQLMYQVSAILENSRGVADLQEIAKEVGYTRDYINRVVKKHTGRTLTEYRRFFLLLEAARLLRETDENVTEISAEVGYLNRTYFNREFRELFGVTPAAYRREKPSVRNLLTEIYHGRRKE